MARWKLTTAHYLTVPGTVWEYKELDRTTGRQARKVYPVPLFLDPKDSADWNYKGDEMIVVAYDNAKFPRDIVFEGPPTPDMEPLDDEATEISDKTRSTWRHPIEDEFVGAGGYSASLLSSLERQIGELMAGKVAEAKSVSIPGVDQAQFDELKDQVKALMEQNAALATQVSEKPKVKRI